jgi:hypothetical protein
MCSPVYGFANLSALCCWLGFIAISHSANEPACDERFNGGDQLPDYFIDCLRRAVLSYVTTRNGEDFTSPGAAINGPKLIIINEFAGSRGDALPWYFREAKAPWSVRVPGTEDAEFGTI